MNDETQQRHAFLSYVREDSDKVDRLQEQLETAGIPVWRDTADLWPGQDWRMEIRRAITDNSVAFIACFSSNSVSREKTYQNDELTLAVEQLRLRTPGTPWLIPVRFDDCEIPDFDIGGGRTLASLHRLDLFGEGYGAALLRLAEAITRVIGEYGQAQPSLASRAPAADGSERVERKVLLSPEAVIDLQNIESDEKGLINFALEQLAQGDSSRTKTLAASGASAPYRSLRLRNYRIIFRDVTHQWDSAGQSGELLVARIIDHRSTDDLSKAVSRLLSQAEPRTLPDDPLTDRWRHTSDGFKATPLMNITSYAMPGFTGQHDESPFIRIGVCVGCNPIDSDAADSSQIRRALAGFLAREPISSLVRETAQVDGNISWVPQAGRGVLRVEALLAGELPKASAMLHLPFGDLRQAGRANDLACLWIQSVLRGDGNSEARQVGLPGWYRRLVLSLSIAGVFADLLRVELGLITSDNPAARVGIMIQAKGQLAELVDTGDLPRLPGANPSSQFLGYAIADRSGKPTADVAKDFIKQLCEYELQIDVTSQFLESFE